MSRKKAIFLYLSGTLGQIWMIFIIIFILRNLGMVVDYTTPVGMVAIGIGGVSSALWGIWHFSYFYIEGTLPQVQVFGFLLGLLTNCFILSALFVKTNSLWICVMTHSLINVFSQLAVGGNQNISYTCKIIIIVMATALSIREQNKKITDVSVI